MPILAYEPMIHPANLLDLPEPSAATQLECAEPDIAHTPPKPAKWFVAHTKPRQEKALARFLFTHDIGYFCPQSTQTPSNAHRRPTSWIPLFTGYVFVHANEAGRVEALQSNRIATCLQVTHQTQLTEDLRRVKRLVESGLPLFPEESLAPGKRVRIAHGPLAGLHGTIEARPGRCRFIVTVDFIRKGVSVELDARVLEPAGPEPEACGERHHKAAVEHHGTAVLV